ncbi:hypothetical protein KP509_18G082300 [Ceratopteris richardii]|uniref:FAM192A/Fyv6 N-terminal domain-containing protein n=1 Tax=Ceratopteris richardii TaxID=49495 RepID=A0A8T2SV58_CERRI|nr:hypothetical protein KP509_18G082300 [Ceratopteris richardii]
MADASATPARLLKFISEQEVEEIKKKRAERGDVGSDLPVRPLYEVLKENKDKQQAEFNERFKHQPPKALDEDETEFLENVEKYRREQELLVANEEAEQLLAFQIAVAKRTTSIREPVSSSQQNKESLPQKEKRPASEKSILSTIKIKPQLKKSKVNDTSTAEKTLEPPSSLISETPKQEQKSNATTVTSLVAYGTDSEEDE